MGKISVFNRCGCNISKKLVNKLSLVSFLLKLIWNDVVIIVSNKQKYNTGYKLENMQYKPFLVLTRIQHFWKAGTIRCSMAELFKVFTNHEKNDFLTSQSFVILTITAL